MEYDISLSEYPNEICLTLYHSLCPLCCGWCFNKNRLKNSAVSYSKVKKIINNNYEFVSSVCLTGGEPLLIKDFYKISKYVKNNDLKLKINTSGIIPITQDVDIDYVNISIKGDFFDYQSVGYQKTQDDLINSINSFFVSKFIEFSIVYYPEKEFQSVRDFIYKLKLPNSLVLAQLQQGYCLDNYYNTLKKVTRQKLLQEIGFYDINCKYYIETREYGREEVKR